jgi:hypothetical protein
MWFGRTLTWFQRSVLPSSYYQKVGKEAGTHPPNYAVSISVVCTILYSQLNYISFCTDYQTTQSVKLHRLPDCTVCYNTQSVKPHCHITVYQTPHSHIIESAKLYTDVLQSRPNYTASTIVHVTNYTLSFTSNCNLPYCTL